MALSPRTQFILDHAMASTVAAKEIKDATAARVAVSDKHTTHLHNALGHKSLGNEIVKAIANPRTLLSLEAKRQIIVFMADAAAGNELINHIQGVVTPPVLI